MAVLVIGGGGYIGSHMVKRLLHEGEAVVIIDDFSKGYEDAILGGTVVRGNYGSEPLLNEVFTTHGIDAVMVFASFIEVGESVSNPAIYYGNNVTNCFTFLNAMVKHGIGNLVFSSSAAIYGAHKDKISEKFSCNPLSPYGKTKYIVELTLADYSHAYDLRSCSLRYFNAAGADPQGLLGERHNPETHLIPLVLQVASGHRDIIKIFGDDYDTHDGTCVRDYVHIEDLCEAHLLALKHLRNGGPTTAYNLGNAEGYSVKDVIRVAKDITARPIAVEVSDRRPGDCAYLVANSAKIRHELGWQPRFSALETMVDHAWKWELQRGKRW